MADEPISDLHQAIAPYAQLLEDLVDGRMTPIDFETQYLRAYKAIDFFTTDEVFKVVDRFFSDVDEYVDDPQLRDPTNGDLGPDELKAAAEALLRRAGLRP